MRLPILAAVTLTLTTPASAQTAREILISAAFTARDRPSALARIDRALAAADATLARNPADREARLQRAMAIGYRGKLRRDRGDAQAARRGFEALVAADPRDAEAQMALAGFHLGAIHELGPLLARTALGARRASGLRAETASLAAGGGRAIFPAVAAHNRILLDPRDTAGARALAEAALKARIARPEDRIMQRHAAQLLPLLRANDGKAAAALADKLIPFGRVAN